MEAALRYLEGIPGFDKDAYLEAKTSRCIRANTLKINPEELKEQLLGIGFSLEKIPWLDYGWRVDAERLGNTIEHSLGYYFIQDAASMAVSLLMNAQKGDKILDISAAPGAKITHIAQITGNSGVMVANDVSYKRLKALTANVQRMGVTSAVVTQADGREYSKWARGLFDKVLVDAPCSGLGKIRFIEEISGRLENLKLEEITKLQQQILISAFECLKPGGELVYSTCTLTIEENEANVQKLLEKFADAKIQKIRVNGLRHEKGIADANEELENCMRIYPYLNGTDGFFIAKIRKGD